MFVAIVMLLAPASARKPAPDDAVAESFLWYVHNMQRTVAQSRTIRWVLHRRVVGTEVWDELHMAWQPDRLHARWMSPHPGREALAVEDVVHVLPEPGMPVLEVDSESAVVGRAFTEHGQPGLIAALAAQSERLVEDAAHSLIVTDLGGSEVRGEAARCFRVGWPEDYEAAPRSELCVNLRTNLVARYTTSAWELEFSDLRVDEDLDDRVFEVAALTDEK